LGFGFVSNARADEFLTACGPYANNVFQHAAVFGINTGGSCPNPPYSGGGLGISSAGSHVAQGQNAHWQATAPSGLAIVGASVPNGSLVSAGVNDGQQYGGGFYWAGGGAQTHDGEASASFGSFSSGYFGLQLICGVSTCTTGNSQLDVGQITLQVSDTVGPNLVAPDGLWQAPGWVRGDWTLHYYGDSPSGLCSLSASLNGQAVPGSGSPQNPSVWHQCAAPAVAQTVHTGQYGQGAMPLALNASDAAGVPVNYTKTVYVDNSLPAVTMSGPGDAPSTAGVQYVTATASGSPSGIAGLSCSVDGAASQWHPGTTAQVPVSGVGVHSVQCSAADNAVDQAGNHGWSNPALWSLKIGLPTISAIGFVKIIHALRCTQVRERVRVPARVVTVHRHRKLVRVRRRAHTKVVIMTRCHPETGRRRITVWVTVRRHGKKVRVRRKKIVRVVLLPRVVDYTTRRVPHGHSTEVSGWLGTSTGIALVGQTVRLLAAPDNGQGRFSAVAVVSTAADGSWSARLVPGRLGWSKPSTMAGPRPSHRSPRRCA